MSRARIAGRICKLAGRDVVIQERELGWPSRVSVLKDDTTTRVDLYAGPVSLLDPNRPNDYRLQNPGTNRPVLNNEGPLNICLA